MASLWRYLLAGLGLAALLAGILAIVYLTVPQSAKFAGLDTSRSKTTANRLFVASFQPERGVIRQGELQSWLLTLKTVKGAPVEGAAITVSGGMPQHNHGLPTSPQATDYLGDGRYRIDGLKFTMSGWWQLRFAISAAAGSDTVVFNVVL
ncbi:FixH family protein [Mesorhizobium sp. AR10]|uniref:FixH family protein n=1 Tax=Mesorhizobium sp. AR10 TaxID=2865839 RepID=UPI00215E2D3D|nr:FixH family protein [Mesorhizobium sp. AR10]UVK36502.1 FixH family protein [Mesorhizobium sp. AR10]